MAKITSTRPYGIEIECIMPEGVSHRSLATSITRAFRDAGQSMECLFEGYNHNTRPHWKVVTDASLSGRGAEVVSPVLSGEEGLRQIAIVADAITAAGCTVNVSCGLHVHVNARDLTLEQMKRVAICFVKFEDFFDHIMPPSRRADNNTYVLSNRTRFGSYATERGNGASDAIRACTTQGTFIQAMCGGASHGNRFRKLNVTALLRHGTFEFRQHSGTTEAPKMINWVSLLVHFVERAKDSQPRNRRADIVVTPVQEMQRFFNMFKIEKPVRNFYQARRKELARADEERARRGR